jgi:hypothetical protein
VPELLNPSPNKVDRKEHYDQENKKGSAAEPRGLARVIRAPLFRRFRDIVRHSAHLTAPGLAMKGVSRLPNAAIKVPPVSISCEAGHESGRPEW